MTYLSRIRINPLRAGSRNLLANPRAMRGAVLGGIPDRPTDERTLWRLDTDNPRRPVLFVLSQSKPDWTHMVESSGWPDADGEHAAVRDYTPLLARIALGREFAFRVTANPVQNTSTPVKPSGVQAERAARGERRSYRIGHRTAAQQLTWFLQRTPRWGFEVPPAPVDTYDDKAAEPARDLRLVARNRLSFRKNDAGKPVILHTATFEGRLRITDTSLLTDALLTGIGPAKAYGCGLLTLAPLPGARGSD
ncbi:type I-E CRISPR-associated protein Cas6/Cse3/CasE [Streptomyces sp. 7N604]|uniref:type I-E CRISPR-associated protein Cas6/Cse3/CasE n=1 Tax=Streptomyces sp. 7N604 TaxID=3457415 RepID=UPI003FD0B75D